MPRSYLYKIGQSGKPMTNAEFIAEVRRLCTTHSDIAVRNARPKTVVRAIELMKFFFSGKNIYLKIADRENSKWVKL